MKIYHISGPSGSGKTTLMKKLKTKLSGKRVVFIDTDEIFDKNGMELLNSKKFKNIRTNAEHKAFSKALTKLNDKDAFDIIDRARDDDKDVIIIGHTLFGKANPVHYTDYGYFIDVSPQIIYERLNARHLDELCQYKSAIISAQKQSKSDMYISLLILFKFKIRNGGEFPTSFEKIVSMRNADVKYYKQSRYKIMSPEKIENDIIDLVNDQ